jgi:hypothetical protein
VEPAYLPSDESLLEFSDDKFPQILGCLPSIKHATYLLTVFFEDCNWWFGVIEEETFRADVLDLYSNPLQARVMSLGLLYVALASAFQFLPQAARCHLDGFEDNYGELLYQNARKCLYLCDEHDVESIERLQVMIQVGLYCQNDGKPIRTWNKVGMAVRIAYETRFHREISHSATLSLRDVQLRKRIWWILYISDKMSSLICGRPSAIDEVCVDVSLPLNISSQTAANHVFGDVIIEEDIQSTATEHSCDITSIPIFRIAGKMNRDCLLPLEPPAHSLVMQYDRELTDAVHQLPLYIRSSILDTTEEDIQVPISFDIPYLDQSP